MPSLSHLLVGRAAPTTATVHPCNITPEQTPLEDGQVLVHVAKLVVTANTVTYAMAGDMPVLKYFQHFAVPPDAPDTQAMVPCWGTGVVVSSRCDAVKPGTRLYGYFTFSPSVVLTPSKTNPQGFVDAAPRRAKLIEDYRKYYTRDAPNFKNLSYDEEDYVMATGILFSTGWGMAQMAAIHPAKPTALILTSASSRTARAAAFAARFHKLPVEVIGVTSKGNLEYTRSLGLYDRVVVYGEEASLPQQKVALMDVAGSWRVREALYRHFGDKMILCGKVGLSHVGSATGTADLKGLGGAAPQQFLVFDAIKRAASVYGRAQCAKMLQQATQAYNEAMLPGFRAERHYGADATKAVYDRYVKGTADPKLTYVCSMWPQNLHDPGRSKL
eukprot:Hpha_TRINITY_DN3791_c0_g1::TRINITY_DN3791_c0_g1_i1::g.23876::m.23876